jgi:hypothetical protein
MELVFFLFHEISSPLNFPVFIYARSYYFVSIHCSSNCFLTSFCKRHSSPSVSVTYRREGAYVAGSITQSYVSIHACVISARIPVALTPSAETECFEEFTFVYLNYIVMNRGVAWLIKTWGLDRLLHLFTTYNIRLQFQSLAPASHTTVHSSQFTVHSSQFTRAILWLLLELLKLTSGSNSRCLSLSLSCSLIALISLNPFDLSGMNYFSRFGLVIT